MWQSILSFRSRKYEENSAKKNKMVGRKPGESGDCFKKEERFTMPNVANGKIRLRNDLWIWQAGEHRYSNNGGFSKTMAESLIRMG